MKKTALILGSLLSAFPFVNLPAQDLRLPQDPSTVETPEVGKPSAVIATLASSYDEYYSALNVFSEVAFRSPQGSAQYFEAAASGDYLRGRIEDIGAYIKKETGRDYRPLPTRGADSVSWKVRNELNDALGFGAAPVSRGETRGVPIKKGYCQINYVKNNVPFLVQYDGFLNKGEVIMTFDDGPSQLTKEMSADLKEAGASALFFVLGRNIAGPAGLDRVKTEAADGHLVGVHGYNHATEGDKPFTNYSTGKAVADLGKVVGMIDGAIGKKPSFFRPPYGIISVEQLNAARSELGLIPVGWTIDTLDWSTKDPEVLFQNTVKMIQQRGKGIILMHDIHQQDRAVAGRLAKWLVANGFKIVSPERLAEAYGK
jgi:peptidoglycan/xylan/chitin deacetylase (PgdA/CDA1 family)